MKFRDGLLDLAALVRRLRTFELPTLPSLVHPICMQKPSIVRPVFPFVRVLTFVGCSSSEDFIIIDSQSHYFHVG